MKKIISFVFYFLPLFLSAQDGFKVTMHIKGLGDHNVKVSFQKNGKSDVDTLVKSDTDLVIWEGKVEDPQLVRVEIMDVPLITLTPPDDPTYIYPFDGLYDIAMGLEPTDMFDTKDVPLITLTLFEVWFVT